VSKAIAKNNGYQVITRHSRIARPYIRTLLTDTFKEFAGKCSQAQNSSDDCQHLLQTLALKNI